MGYGFVFSRLIVMLIHLTATCTFSSIAVKPRWRFSTLSRQVSPFGINAWNTTESTFALLLRSLSLYYRLFGKSEQYLTQGGVWPKRIVRYSSFAYRSVHNITKYEPTHRVATLRTTRDAQLNAWCKIEFYVPLSLRCRWCWRCQFDKLRKLLGDDAVTL